MKRSTAVIIVLSFLLLASCDNAPSLSSLAGTSSDANDTSSKKSQITNGMTRADAIAKLGKPSLQKQYAVTSVRDSDRLQVITQVYDPAVRGQSGTISECQWDDNGSPLIVLFHYKDGAWPLLGVVEPFGGETNLPNIWH